MLTEGVEDFNRGTNYLNNKRYEKAIQFFKRALKKSPVKEVYLNTANCLAALDQDIEAARCYSLAADPNTPHFNGICGTYPTAVNNLGLMNYRYGNDQDAIDCYLECLEKEPLNWDCIWNYSNALLRQCCDGLSTEWNTAWKMYSYRFKRSDRTAIDPHFNLWNGIDRVKKLVVLHEQGQGDKLQFARYLKKLKDHCDEVVLQVEPELHSLFTDHGWKVVWNEGLYDHLDGVGVPWCSLAQHLGLEADPHWINCNLYQPHDFGKNNHWIIHNSGNPLHSNDRNRSCTWDNFKALEDLGKFYTLKPTGPSWINKLNSKCWSETIGYLLGAKGLITVDTSVAHMAGSLGVKCWLLQPLKETDWRWGNTGKSTMWYPSVTVVRNPQSWKKTFEQVYDELKAL
jgi:tetratricopeptide (TPR) repeat protein